MNRRCLDLIQHTVVAIKIRACAHSRTSIHCTAGSSCDDVSDSANAERRVRSGASTEKGCCPHPDLHHLDAQAAISNQQFLLPSNSLSRPQKPAPSATTACKLPFVPSGSLATNSASPGHQAREPVGARMEEQRRLPQRQRAAKDGEPHPAPRGVLHALLPQPQHAEGDSSVAQRRQAQHRAYRLYIGDTKAALRLE